MLATVFIIVHVNTMLAVSDLNLIGQVGGGNYVYETMDECAQAIETGLKLEGNLKDHERNSNGQYVSFTNSNPSGGFSSYVCMRVKIPLGTKP